MPLFSSFAEDGASQLNNNTANKNVIAPADETSEQRLRGSRFEENQISRDAESNSPIAFRSSKVRVSARKLATQLVAIGRPAFQ
jgi:hypothetical protein